MPQNLKLGIVAALASAICFGVYPAVSRFVYADGGNATFMILLTTGMRALGLWLFCLFTAKKLFKTGPDIKQGALGGFFQAISVLCIYFSLVYIPGPVMIIIVFSHTLMLLFFLAWKKEVKLNALTLLTTLAALFGLSLVLDLWVQEHNYNLFGMLLAFVAAIATGTRLYVYGREMKTRNPAVVGAENFIFAVLFILPVIFFILPQAPTSLSANGFALLAALAQTFATFGMFYGIALIGSFRFSLFLKLEPIFTALFSIIFMKEILSWHQYVGMLTVIGSLVAFQYFDGKKKAP